jgi:hypothetical protein
MSINFALVIISARKKSRNLTSLKGATIMRQITLTISNLVVLYRNSYGLNMMTRNSIVRSIVGILV